MNPLNDVAAMWRLEDNTGADAIGGLTLTPPNNSGNSWPAGKRNNGWSNDSSSTIRGFTRAIGSAGVLATPENGFSLSVWSRTVAVPNIFNKTIAGLGNNTGSSGDWGWVIVLYNVSGGAAAGNRLYTRSSGGVIDMIELLGATNDNFWHHFVATRAAGSNARLRLYVDGVMVEGTSTGAKTPSAAPFCLGGLIYSNADLSGSGSSSTQAIKGGLDEATYWTRELSETEVALLYADDAGLFTQDEADPGSGTFSPTRSTGSFASSRFTAELSSARMTGTFARG